MKKVSGVPETNLKVQRGRHPNSLANLKSGWHGQDLSMNGVSLTQELKAKLRKDPTLRKQIVESTLEGALKREPTPFREVWDRVDGRLQDNPPQVQGVTVINILVTGEHMREMLAKVAERTGELLPAGRETPIAEAGEKQAEG